MSYHVRDVLESAREAAPAPRTSADDIIATARRMRTRRTAAAVTGGAAAVLAVVAALVTVPGSGSGPGTREPVGESLPFAAAEVSPLLTLPDGYRTVLGEYRAGPYTIGPVGEVTAGYQELPVYRAGETWSGDDGTEYPLVVGTMTFYRPGVFDPRDSWDDGFAVTVAGRPGIGRKLSYAATPDGKLASAGPDQVVQTAVAWQYASGAWATYVPRGLDANRSTEDALAIAAAVTKSAERKVRLPYRLDYLPEGWQIVAVTETGEKVSSSVSEVFLHRGPLAKDKLAVAVDEMLPESMKITVIRGEPKNQEIRGQDGVHCAKVPSCTIIDGDYLIDVEGRFSGSLTVEDVRKIADGLHPVEIAERKAWVPVGR